MNNIDAFHRLLRNYKFVEEIPGYVQDYISGSQQKALKYNLKKLGVYSVRFGIILWVFFLFRKIGYNLSIPVIKILTWGLISIAGLSITGEALYLLSKTSGDIIVQREEVTKDNQIKNITVPDSRKYRLGIAWFTARDNDNNLAKEVTQNITKELARILGEDNVIELNSDRKGRKVNLVLIGSAGRIGRKIFISVRIVDVENSAVLFTESTEINDMEYLTDKCRYLSERLSMNLKKEYFKNK